MSRQRVSEFAALRLLVAFLGEKEQLSWWDSSFLNTTGRRFLAIDYPKTALAAAVNAASESARRVHDERIGKGRVAHLFRLPPMLEHRLHQQLLQPEATRMEAWLTTKDAALTQLAELAGKDTESASGPFRIGAVAALGAADTVGRLAGAYLHSFREGQQSMPYFADNKG